MSGSKTYPKAKQLPIKPGSNDPAIIPVGIIWHVDAGNSLSLFRFFRDRSGGIESHMFFKKDGSIEQYRDFLHEADAQGDGNSWVIDGKRYGFISCETQGFGKGEWTDAQLAAIRDFSVWAAGEFGFPLRQVTVSRPWSAASGGVGYHRLFAAWNKDGHSCPGDDRVRQFHDVLVPWMAEVSKPHYQGRVTPKPIVSLARLSRAARRGDKSAPGMTAVVQAALRDAGCLGRFYIRGNYGRATKAAYSKWQRKLGYSGQAADGVPGHDSLSRLGKRAGFNVSA